MQIGGSWHTPLSFHVLAFHNGWKDRIDTADDPSTSDENLVNFGTVTPGILQVCLLCHTFPVLQIFSFRDLALPGITPIRRPVIK